MQPASAIAGAASFLGRFMGGSGLAWADWFQPGRAHDVGLPLSKNSRRLRSKQPWY